MPIYEYRCAACKRRSSVLVRSASATSRRPVCEYCGSGRLSRLVSKFAVHRAAGGANGEFDDTAGMDDVDENDPQSVARWARRMRAESGEDLGPEFDEMVGRMEAGESPDEMFGGDDGGEDDDFD